MVTLGSGFINNTSVVPPTHLFSFVSVGHRVPGIATAYLLSQRRDGVHWLRFTFMSGVFLQHFGGIDSTLVIVGCCLPLCSVFINSTFVVSTRSLFLWANVFHLVL